MNEMKLGKSVTSPPFLGGEFNTHGHMIMVEITDKFYELKTELKYVLCCVIIY